MWAQSLGQEDPLEEEMATYSSILAWRIPWTEKHGGPQSMGSQRVRHTSSNLAGAGRWGLVQRGSAQAAALFPGCLLTLRLSYHPTGRNGEG